MSQSITVATIAPALIGSLVGGLLAFGSNWMLQSWERTRSRRAAVNSAIATLAMMNNDFGNFKGAYPRLLAQQREHLPGLPDWQIVLPINFNFSPDLKFSYAQLGFIAEFEPHDALLDLHMAERRYRDLAATAKQLNEATMERQRKSETVLSGMTRLDKRVISERLGPELAGRLDGLHAAILQNLERDQESYDKARDSIRAAGVRAIGKRGLIEFELDVDRLGSSASIRRAET